MAANELYCTAEDRTWNLPSRAPFMRMSWFDLLFMHYKVDADLLRKLLPDSIELDTFDGQAWIGIVPFQMADVSPRWVPNLPLVSRFPELNVRTYVTVGGKPGVWFFSLDATSKIAVRAARWLFHLNYVDANIGLKKASNHCPGKWIQYHSLRTDANAAPAELLCEYRPVGDWYFAKPDTLVHWLTARYCLYTTNSQGQLFRGEIHHQPWRIRDAQAIVRHNSMTEGLGLDLGDQKPLLHYAEETKVVAWSLDKVE
jgi:uncharacterized protein YqjF (DUF2071 family)